MSCVGSPDSFSTLDYAKVQKLGQVLEEPVEIHSSRDDFPSVSVKPVDLVRSIEERILKLDEVLLHDVRLNGSAATWVVDENSPMRDRNRERAYNDIDLIFRLDIPAEYHFDGILNAALFGFLDAVRDSGCILPGLGDGEIPNPYKLHEAYGRKLVRVWSTSDQWCLVSFRNLAGLDLELKFVGRCRRPYEYSVDSFQVILDSYLALERLSKQHSPRLFPTVVVETMWGDVNEALRHVNEKWIATRNPESIRGGGLLKYCKLLVFRYRPATADVQKMQRYMCSRFFIDFPSPAAVGAQIGKYLETHFCQVRAHYRTASQASAFLWTLFQVVEQSADCLTVVNKQPILRVIINLARSIEQPFLSPAPRPVLVASRPSLGNVSGLAMDVAHNHAMMNRCIAA